MPQSDEAKAKALREWLDSFPVDPVKVAVELRAIYDRLGRLVEQLERYDDQQTVILGSCAIYDRLGVLLAQLEQPEER